MTSRCSNSTRRRRNSLNPQRAVKPLILILKVYLKKKMDEKSVRVIRNLVSRSGEVAGDVMQKSTAAKLVDAQRSCPICGGSGWKDVPSGNDRRVTRCDCFLQIQAKHHLAATGIPVRYVGCDFYTSQTGGSDSLAGGKLTI